MNALKQPDSVPDARHHWDASPASSLRGDVMTAPECPSVSVIVPAYGSAEYLRHCLKGLSTQAVTPHEIIVSVDGGDERLAMAARYFGVRVLMNQERQGPAVARNLGARMASGDVLLFVDSDVVCPATVVGQVAQMFCESPELAALFGSYDDGPVDPGFFSQFRNLLHYYMHQKANVQARTFWSGCGAIRKDVFESVGGFCEGSAVEDIELGYRMNEAGHSVRLYKSLQVKHLKHWNWLSTIQTDLFTRSLSWSRLLMESKGRYLNDLNMDWNSRASIAVSLSLLVCPVTVVAGLKPVAGAAVLSLVWLALNWEILRFFARVRGMWFAVRVVPALWLHYVCGGLGYGLAWAEWGAKRIAAMTRLWHCGGQLT